MKSGFHVSNNICKQHPLERFLEFTYFLFKDNFLLLATPINSWHDFKEDIINRPWKRHL